MSPLPLLLVIGTLLHCGLTAPVAIHINHTKLFSSFDLKQRIAYRIGQVECLKTLGENNTQYGLGVLHHGDYATETTRFSIRQRIAFLHGQIQCLRIHLSSFKHTQNTTSQEKVYLDCKDAYQQNETTSGLYTINPDNQTAFQVYCDMDTSGGGWTVIQRRLDGSVDFSRTWAECEQGFGNKSGEYWLGLSYIHRLTTSAAQLLRVDLEDFQSNTAYSQYTTFTVANAVDKYRLYVSGSTGPAGDAMSANSGFQFTTEDSDNDINMSLNCAIHNKGPWWHHQCSHSNLNSEYSNTPNLGYPSGVTWYEWKSQWYSMKKASMKIRRK